MDFEYDIASEAFNRPTKTMNDFIAVLENSISRFEKDNLFVDGSKKNLLDFPHYYSLLNTLFHQAWHGPGTFALAGSMIDENFVEAKNYLLHHSEEEKMHWTWIISDLRSTGYKGSDPRTLQATVAAQAYIAYSHYLAFKFPVGRLAMAAVLEGLSGQFGRHYGAQFARAKGLKPDQVRFFIAHSELDQGHSTQIIDILKNMNLRGEDWAKLCHAAECTEALYKAMYNEAFVNSSRVQ